MSLCITTEFRQLADGRGELAVTNNNERMMVTAFVIIHQSFRPDGGLAGRGVDWRDVLFTPEQHNFEDAIQPLETRRFRFGVFRQGTSNGREPRAGSPEIRSEIELKAAVFSDGTTWGDPEWVQKIVECRRYFYTDLGVAIEKINTALDSQATVDSLREEFEQLRNAAPRPGPDFEHLGEGKAARGVFGTVVTNLQMNATETEDPRSWLPTYLPTLATWQMRIMRIGNLKPSILDPSKQAEAPER